MITAEKTCFKCESKKPMDAFYRHPQIADGRLNKCKECAKRDVRHNYKSNVGHYQQYEQVRAKNPDRVRARDLYQKSEKGKDAMKRGRAAYAARSPEKRAAHVAVGNAVRDGRLTKAPCEQCGSVASEAHHDDYSAPLSVRWLCHQHHVEHHSK